MTEAVFYLLPTTSARDRQAFACRLAEKAYKLGHKVYVRTASDEESRNLDDLLWTFRAGSFLPHQRYDTAATEPSSPILVGRLPPPEPWQEIVINLAPDCPEATGASRRILEILDASPGTRRGGRMRYRHYREAGFALETHALQQKGR